MKLELTSKSSDGKNTSLPMIPEDRSFGFMAAAFLSVGAMLAGLLWWRFGESVYANAIINAVLACF